MRIAAMAMFVACGSRTGMLSETGGPAGPICPGSPECLPVTGGAGGVGPGGNGGSIIVTDAAGGAGGIGPCLSNGRPCTPEECTNRCHKYRIGGYTELLSSARRCACASADRCSSECADTYCAGQSPSEASPCEKCVLRMALRPPADCISRACGPDGCVDLTICGLQARDCDELLACLKECPPL
jgi:hypothetical protein